jgi:predicted NBD/HSP70 family sugar kinase
MASPSSFLVGIDLGGTAAKLGLLRSRPGSPDDSSTDGLVIHSLRAPLPAAVEDRWVDVWMRVGLLVYLCIRSRFDSPYPTNHQPPPTKSTPAAVLALLHDGYTQLLQEAQPKLEGSDPIRIAGVGVGFPGQVKGGVAVGAANLSPVWREVPLAEELSARLEGSPPVVLMNDADAALLAEVSAGAARGRRDVVMISKCW